MPVRRAPMPRLCATGALLAIATAAAHAADDHNLQFHGFASQGYFLTRNNALFTSESQDKGTFEFNEVALNAVATPVDRLRVGIQLFAQDFGDSFNNKPQIDWAYGDYSLPTYGVLDLGITAGRLKMGHGLYNDYRDLDVTRTSVFIPMAVYNPRLRDYFLAVNGLGVHGTVNADAFGSFDFMTYLGGQSSDPHEGTIHDIFFDRGLDLDRVHIEAVDGANVTWNTPLEGLRLKYSLFNLRGLDVAGTIQPGAIVPLIPGSAAQLNFNQLWDTIVSVEYQRGDLTLAAEAEYWYLKGLLHGDAGIPVTIPVYQIIHSAYLSAAWRLAPQWEVEGIWQWNEVDTVTAAKDKFYGFTAAVRFDPIEHWLIKAEYTWIHGTSLLRAAEQPHAGFDEVWGYFALKTTFDF
ncbi:MAG: hypothetical protein H0X38_02300 [Planctomycetes bacterium]|nr:hypothetical protein [Planctomycetota bacterium]